MPGSDPLLPVITQAPLAPGEVRVFYAFTELLADAAFDRRCRALLSPEESAREQRFRFLEDRQSYLLAHALVRSALSRLCGVEPGALAFESGEHGRPELIEPACQPRLRFNLSHTRGLVACAVGLEHDLGVDVEHIERRLEIDSLAASVFSEHERAALDQLPDERRRERFFQLWTLKEAYIKAVGVGLSLPLRAITLEPEAAQGPAIAFDAAAIADDPRAWWFAVRRVGSGHMLAVALKRARPDAVLIQGLESQS